MTAPAGHAEAAIDLPMGEILSVPERVIVAPVRGTFRWLDGDVQKKAGDLVARGDVIGVVQSLGASTLVHSPFEGLLVAMVALDGERLRPGQAVAWLRVTPVGRARRPR
ncbi:MAG: hypothetical protein M3357_08620 [Actinomycetota bacterium]|nr:hypothetical protein [Actinomycetota bacterium]